MLRDNDTIWKQGDADHPYLVVGIPIAQRLPHRRKPHITGAQECCLYRFHALRWRHQVVQIQCRAILNKTFNLPCDGAASKTAALSNFVNTQFELNQFLGVVQG